MAKRKRPAFDRPRFWLLHDDHSVEPLESGDPLEWARAFGLTDRRVALDWWVVEVDGERVGVRVSTVFIGLDHNHFVGPGAALLFETQVFGGLHAGRCWRYATWDEAVAGHREVALAVREGLVDVVASSGSSAGVADGAAAGADAAEAEGEGDAGDG